MSDTRWEAARRLGVQTFACAHCQALGPMLLPGAGEDIRSRHWRVEKRWRSQALSSPAEAWWLVCSQGCAQKLSAIKAKEYRNRLLPRARVSVHGPYTPAECVESR